ncbi:MAG: hypothetical protein ACRBHB_08165 [Arenicella sp.]
MAKQVPNHMGPSRIPIPDLSSSSVRYKLRELHDGLLKKQQKTWYQLVSTPHEILKKNDVVEPLNDIVSKFSGSSSFMINDPLLCFFLPLWDSLDESPVVVFHYSDPLECAIDLQKKWRFPLSVGLALWESYVLAACKNIVSKPHVLMSANKLRKSGTTHLRAVSKELAVLGESDLSKSILESLEDLSEAHSLSAYSAEQSEWLQAPQFEIFKLLERGSLKLLAQRDISYQSVDILEKYGQLRAGFELTQKALEDTQAKLALAEQKQGLWDVSDSAAEVRLDHGQLSQVTIHLRDIPSFKFHCEADAPILDVLRDHLVNNTHNEMIYLNCGETHADEAIYFMSADLLSIEIENIKAH